MKTSMCVSVEFLPGTDLKDAILEAKEKAALWNVRYVIFKFNNTSFSIGRTADIEKAERQYKESNNHIVSA